jgi:hypothetical protein
MAQWFVPPIVVPVELLALLLLVALLRPTLGAWSKETTRRSRPE